MNMKFVQSALPDAGNVTKNEFSGHFRRLVPCPISVAASGIP